MSPGSGLNFADPVLFPEILFLISAFRLAAVLPPRPEVYFLGTFCAIMTPCKKGRGYASPPHDQRMIFRGGISASTK